MSDGRFVGYYWQICALLGEKVHLLDTGHLDIPEVAFATVLAKIERQYLKT